MTPNDEAIQLVRTCLRRTLHAIARRKEYESIQKSCSKWALREILTRLERNRSTAPLILIEQFRDQMERYSCMNSHTSYYFSAAKDTAEWIIDLLLT